MDRILPFVGLKESIIENFQKIPSTGDIAQLLQDLQTVQNFCESCKICAISLVLYLVWKFPIMDAFNPTKGTTSIQ